jgi:hypothetical protein
MAGYFSDRRRAAAILTHSIMLRHSQAAALKRTGAVDSTVGAIYQQGIEQALNEAAAEGSSSDLVRAVVGLVLDVEPRMMSHHIQALWDELLSAAFVEVDEVANGDEA